MAYDYQGAIKAGANPTDVGNYLAKQTGYNFDGATKAGGNINAVLGYMSGLPFKSATPPPEPSQTGSGHGALWDAAGNLIKGLTSSEQSFGQDLSTIGSSAPGEANDINAKEEASKTALLTAIHNQTNTVMKQHLLDAYQKIWGGVAPTTAGDINPAFNKTPEQVLGDAGGVALDAASGGTYGEAAKGAETGKLLAKAPSVVSDVVDAAKGGKGIVQSAVKGAKEGATVGAGLGGAYGIDQGLQNNEDATGIAKSGTEGLVAGGVGGAVLGGGAGAISGGVDALATRADAQATKTATTQEQKALSAITPNTKDLTPTAYKEMINAGRIEPRTASEAPKYILKPQEEALAKKYAPLLQSNDPIKNINNVTKEIINKDQEVGKFLAKDPQVYVKSDLKDALTKLLSSVGDITIPKSQLSEARQDLIDTVMSRIPNNNSGRTFADLWQFRKNFDSTIDQKLNAFNGAPSLKREMATALRNGMQTFIADNTKDGVYAGKMKDMTELYKLNDLMGTSAVKQKGLNAIQAWAKANPVKAKAIGYGTLFVGGAVAGGAALSKVGL